MNRNFKTFACIWAICLAMFQCIIFLVPTEHNASFWIGYVAITLAFLGQLGCGYVALKERNAKRLFYNIPLIMISYTGLVLMLLAGVICMAMPGVSIWIGVILCLLVLGLTTISVLSAKTAADIVDSIDHKVATRSAFIKDLTSEVDGLAHRANTPMLKKQCQKVYEALRYSDPMSTEALSSINRRIKEEFDALTDAVIADDLDGTEVSVKELLTLIRERNNICKSIK